MRREAEQFELRKFEHKFEHSKIEIIRIKLGRSRADRHTRMSPRTKHAAAPSSSRSLSTLPSESGLVGFWCVYIFFQILKFFLVIGCFEFRNVEQAGPFPISNKYVEFIHNYALKYLAERKFTSVFWISVPLLVAIKPKFQA